MNQILSALCLGIGQESKKQTHTRQTAAFSPAQNGIEPYIPCRSALVKPTLLSKKQKSENNQTGKNVLDGFC